MPKCATLKVGRSDFDYKLNGESIPEVRRMRDLGVLVTNDLKFREHTTHVVRSASVICNLALRSFIVKNVDFYIKLYNTLIVPRFLYCSAVWSPSLACDIALLEKVRRRFIRLVSNRCNISPSDVALPHIVDVHREADHRVLQRIFNAGEESKFFNIVNNNGLRAGPWSIRTKCVAPTNVINNLFPSWTTRVVRQDRPFIIYSLNKATLN